MDDAKVDCLFLLICEWWNRLFIFFLLCVSDDSYVTFCLLFKRPKCFRKENLLIPCFITDSNVTWIIMYKYFPSNLFSEIMSEVAHFHFHVKSPSSKSKFNCFHSWSFSFHWVMPTDPFSWRLSRGHSSTPSGLVLQSVYSMFQWRFYTLDDADAPNAVSMPMMRSTPAEDYPGPWRVPQLLS